MEELLLHLFKCKMPTDMFIPFTKQALMCFSEREMSSGWVSSRLSTSLLLTDDVPTLYCGTMCDSFENDALPWPDLWSTSPPWGASSLRPTWARSVKAQDAAGGVIDFLQHQVVSQLSLPARVRIQQGVHQALPQAAVVVKNQEQKDDICRDTEQVINLHHFQEGYSFISRATGTLLIR